jgi:transposase
MSSYPSDLSDGQWQKIAKFFERPDARGAREKHPKRRVVEACFYRLREGCRWRALPHDFPPWGSAEQNDTRLGWGKVLRFWRWRFRFC